MIVLAALVAGSAALFVLAPLLGWGSAPAFETTSPAADRHEELLARRREVLAAIKDLEMEHEVGKLTREDYERSRELLGRQAIEIYRQLDQDAPA